MIPFNRNAEYIRKNWPDIVVAAKNEMERFHCSSIFVALHRVTGHDLNTHGFQEVMSVGPNRLVIGRCDRGTWSLVKAPSVFRARAEKDCLEMELAHA